VFGAQEQAQAHAGDVQRGPPLRREEDVGGVRGDIERGDIERRGASHVDDRHGRRLCPTHPGRARLPNTNLYASLLIGAGIAPDLLLGNGYPFQITGCPGLVLMRTWALYDRMLEPADLDQLQAAPQGIDTHRRGEAGSSSALAAPPHHAGRASAPARSSAPARASWTGSRPAGSCLDT